MNRRGFTLIELMIVVVIIGILAALAVPRFAMASWRTKEKEAEVVLKHLYTMQSVFFAERGEFAATISDLETVGFQAATLTHFEQITNAHMVSNVCLQALEPEINGKRINFADGMISDC